MPVYHFIVHTYGSWLPDHSDGYYDRKEPHRHAQNQNLGRTYKAAAKHDFVELNVMQQQVLLHHSVESFAHNNMTLHAIAVVNTHLHLVVGWSIDRNVDATKSLVKQILTHLLNRHANRKSGRWFSRGTGDRQIRDTEHLVELINRYFPQHGELVWIESRIQQML